MSKKPSEHFEKTIKKVLDKKAMEDFVFNEKYKAKEFKLEDCINYIFTTVEKSGINGFVDSEIFSMAIHYVDEYQTEKFDIKDGIKLDVVVNHTVQLTPEEIAQAKEDAKKTILNEVREKMTSKPKKKVKTATVVKTEDNKPSNEPTQSALLF